MVALIPDIGINRGVGVRLLDHLLQQPPVDNVGHLCAVLWVHGAAVAGTIGIDGLHWLLLMSVVHKEDLFVHQGGCK